jgi:hypothetical protein
MMIDRRAFLGSRHSHSQHCAAPSRPRREKRGHVGNQYRQRPDREVWSDTV